MARLLCWLEGQRLIRLALLFNLPFLLLRVHRQAYDTYTHIFFADHYRYNWWSLWEPRWYLGFSLASYPPLVHQFIALLSWPLEFIIAAFAPAPEVYPGAFRWLGEEVAYGMVQLAVLATFPAAVRAFARIFVPARSGTWAGLLAIVLPALNLSAWAFGQLPTLAATTMMLFALARGAHFLCTGDRRALLHALALAATAAATHHAVFLFVPFAALALTLHVARCTPPATLLLRALTWASFSALGVALMLWPFLQWSAGQSLQTAIDHASRYNFFERPEATLFFFWPVYGPLILALPLLLRRRWWRLGLAIALLFTLSLGGTTPLPRVLFGAGWEWLTYDRFGLWAATLLLIPAGATLTGLRRQRRISSGVALTFIGGMAAASVAAGGLALLAQTQPRALNLTPIIQFLNTQSQYRYLTLGFGDQFAKLSAITRNGTLDGNYHTARPLPELQQSGLGALDGAVWNPRGVWALEPVLREPGRYGVRWALVNHMAYESVLRAAGWRYRFDVGEVQAWEHAAVTAAVTPPPPDDRAAALWWGVMPLLALALAAGLLATKFAQINLRVVRHALLAVTVALLSFWWVTVLRPETEALPQIYFTYESVLLFASDVALTLTLAIWIVECVVRRQAPLLPAPLYLIPFATLLSTLTSVDPTLTLAFTLHLCLLAGLFVMLVNDPPAATTMGRWFGAALLLQCGLALAQAVAQNTFMLHDLYLRWPGEVEAAMRGASVAANANGDRWLRAYGTLPHPNVLGAMLLAYAGAAWERWLTAGRRVWLILLMLSALAIGLTLSRAAWLGAAVMIVALWLWLPRGAIARWRGATSVCALAAIALLLPLASFVMSRTGVTGDSNALERASTLERSLLTGFAFDAFRAQPLTGVGAAGFVQWAANTLPERYPFQPVHSVPLLILAETGLFGAATLSACVMLIAWRMWQRRHVMSVAEAVWAAVLAGIGVTALFDHLWYTQAPARTLLAFALALWCVSRQAAETQSG